MIKQNDLDARARSRRDFLAKAGAFFAAAGVAGSVAGTLNAQTASSDLDILNFALRLERLESSFYSAALAKFGASDFANSSAAQSMAVKGTSLYSNLQQIGQQEQSHVMQLTALITKAGASTVAQDCYGFSPYGGDLVSLKTPDSAIATAVALENTGVSAYAGGIGLIQDASIRTMAATIATVEARHASYLNLLTGQSPFPSAFDSAASPTDILNASSKYLANCASFPPTAVAGPKGKSTGTQTFQLDGSGSTSSDGSPVLSYTWESTLGENANVTNASTPKPTVSFLGGPGIYTFVLMIIDAHGNQATDAVKVTYTGS